MIRLSMNEVTTYGWSFAEDVANYSRIGYEGIGVCREKLAMYGEEAGVQLLIESGLRASSLSFCGGFTGGHGRSRDDQINDAVSAMQLACCMDADCVIVHVGTQAGHTANHARRLVVESLSELASVADELQVDLAVEPIHPRCHDGIAIVNNLQRAIDLLDDLNNERIRLALDTYHIGFEKLDLSQIETIARHVAVVQLGDALRPPTDRANRCPIGRGTLPIADIIAALTAGGYNGFFEVELRGQDVEYMLYDDILAESLQASAALTRT